jgi:hypothetical protein
MAENEQKRTKMPLQQAKAQVTLLFLPPGATAPPLPQPLRTIILLFSGHIRCASRSMSYFFFV